MDKKIYRWLRRETSNGYVLYDTNTRQVYRNGVGVASSSIQNTYSLPTFDSRAPLKVYFDFTYLCNLKCRHCITNSSPLVDRQNELSSRRIIAIMDELAAVGVLEMGVGGGEPLCHSDLFLFLDHASAIGINVLLTTNGLLVTPKVAQRLKKCQVSEVRVSFDGSQAVHNNIRGPGTYQKAIKAIIVLLQNGLKTVARITLCNDDESGLDTLFKELAATGVATVKTSFLERRGRAALKENQHLFRYPRDATTAKYLIELAKKHSLKLKLPDDLAYCLELTDGGDLRRGEHRSCGAGLETAYISPNGDVLPCSAIPHRVFGNVRSDSFMNVWTGTAVAEWRQFACSSGAWETCTNQDSERHK